MSHSSAARLRSVRTRIAAASSIVALALAAAPVSAHAQGDALPDGKKILTDYRTALGGADALNKLKSIHMTGAFEMPAMGVKGAVDAYSARPNKQYVAVNIEGLGQIENGSDGKIAWSISPMTGPTIMSGPELKAALEDAAFDDVFRNPDDYTSVTTVEKTTMEGEACYKVKLVSKNGGSSIDCYAIDTHLLVISTETSLSGGEITTVSKDYKPVDGVMMPSKVVIRSAGQEQQVSFTKVETNNVADSKFDLPPQIKALIK